MQTSWSSVLPACTWKRKKKKKKIYKLGVIPEACLILNYSSSQWWSSGLRVWLADDVRPLPVEFENGPLPRQSERKSTFSAKGPQAAIATDLFVRASSSSSSSSYVFAVNKTRIRLCF